MNTVNEKGLFIWVKRRLNNYQVPFIATKINVSKSFCHWTLKIVGPIMNECLSLFDMFVNDFKLIIG